MQSITLWRPTPIAWPPPNVELGPLQSRLKERLKLKPVVFLTAINALALAQWACQSHFGLRHAALPKPRRGVPQVYTDASILLLALVQTAWRFSYNGLLEYLAEQRDLALAVGLPYDKRGRVRCISQSQYWERRQALGLRPYLLFMVGLVWQLMRLGVITGRQVILDATRLRAWQHADPGADWSKYRGTRALFGYKVHALLCRTSALPLFCVVTPASFHEAHLAAPMLLVAVLLYGLRIGVVYADAAYYETKVLRFIVQVLHAWPAVDYNPRRRGKRALATFAFIWAWRRGVLWPRRAIERHFACAKRYFGLKHFQCWTYLRVSQYVILTYCVILGVALAAERYRRPDLRHSRAKVLARAMP